MRALKITDPIKAQAAIAFLISKGWVIDVASLDKLLPGGLTDQDWIDLANGCCDPIHEAANKLKVIDIRRFRK